MDHAHLRGIVVEGTGAGRVLPPAILPGADLLRPLAEYQQAAGGAW